MDKCIKCNSTNLIGMEYADGDYRYDGISEYDCQDCGSRFGRWSGKELIGDDREPPYGEMKYVTKEAKHYNT